MENNDSIEKKIKDAEILFIKTRKTAPQYLLMSFKGYDELKNEIQYRTGKEYIDIDGITNYCGMELLISQDFNFPLFVLTV